jgi:PAS domain S-box-containing protein
MPEARILIVEDEAIAAMDIQQSLVGFGYPLPDLAYTGEEGLRKVEETQPDLVLMDIMMPGIDGVSAAEKIRARFDIPIIFLTAYSDENSLRRARITAPYGYILKPFQERELHITVDVALFRHKMERALKEREKWLATTLRSIGDGVIATDEKGLVTFMNPVAEALLGFKLEEVQQKNLTEVFHIVNRDTRETVVNPVTKVILEGNVVGLANHTILISRDGREIPINDSAAPIKDDHGNVVGVVLVFSDITEREKAEESLRESQTENEFLASLIRAASQPVGIGYPDGRLGLFNRAFEELTGYTADELRSINWVTALTPPEWLEMEKDKLAELHRTSQSVRYEKEYIRKDGTRVPVELLVHFVSDSEGKLLYYYAFVTDLTERKQAQEKVLRLNEELRRNVTGLSVANASLRDARRATLNIMEDALSARKRAEEANDKLQREVTERKKAEGGLRESEERYRSLFENMLHGFAYCKMLYDESGRPLDFIYLNVNSAFGKLTGLEKVAGRKVTEVIPGIREAHPELFDIYGRVALSGRSEKFELEFKPLEQWLAISVYSTERDHFVAIFDDISERKKAEEKTQRLMRAVKEEKDRLAALINSINDEVWFADSQKRFTLANPSALREFGIEASEIDVEKFAASLEIYRPDGSPRPAEEAPPLRALRGEVVTNQEEIIRTPVSGELRYRQVSSAPVRDTGGNIIGSVSVVRDITDLKKVEEALRESEERVRVKLESIISPEGDIGDLELRDIIDAPAIQSLMDNLYKFVHLPVGILDLKGKVLVGVGWQDICTKFHRTHPETCRHCTESDLELTRSVPAGEFRLYKCKNGMWDAITPVIVGGQHMGNLFWGQFFFEDEPLDREFFRAQALKYGFNEDEYLAALDRVPRISREALDTGMAFYLKLSDMLSKLSYSNIKLARSLTERDTLLHSLRESEEGLKRAQEIAHLGSWELDLLNNSLIWSDEVYRIFGLQPQEFAATYEAFLEVVHPDDREAVNEAYSGSLREGKDTYEIEHRIVRKATGEIRYVHERCLHLRDETGRIIRSSGMVHDITERKQAEAEILKLSEDMAARNMELESVNKELEAFIYSVSHDLRAPLRTISSFVEFLVEDSADRLDDQGRDYLARINNGAARMSRLISDLLYLSKISRQDLSRIKIDMSKLALSVISDLRGSDPSRSVEVNIAGDALAFADPRLMEIALSNLLGNAWKFTLKTKNARIDFGALEQDGRTVYYIKDNGAGFNPEYAEKMFLPFQRLHSGEEFEGTGIGLSIVERIIRRHGGKIWAESETGKGAVVFFTLG